MPKTFSFEEATEPVKFGWDEAQPEVSEPPSYVPETPRPIPPPGELRPATLRERIGGGPLGEMFGIGLGAQREAQKELGGGAGVTPVELINTAFQFGSVPPPAAKPIEKATDIPINLLPPTIAGGIQGVRDIALQVPWASGVVSLGKTGGRALLGLFAGDYLAQVPQAYEEYKALRAQGRNQEAARLLVSEIGTGALLGAGAKID